MYDDIIDIKNKLDNAVINHVDNAIKEAALKAKNNSLDPIETYILIQENVDKVIDEINTILGPYSLELTSLEQIDCMISKLMEPYDDAKNIELRKRTDEIMNSKTLTELFERCEELSELCSGKINTDIPLIKRKTLK